MTWGTPQPWLPRLLRWLGVRCFLLATELDLRWRPPAKPLTRGEVLQRSVRRPPSLVEQAVDEVKLRGELAHRILMECCGRRTA